jgi:hypothetical protein
MSFSKLPGLIVKLQLNWGYYPFFHLWVALSQTTEASVG